jgi:hypothetical protein
MRVDYEQHFVECAHCRSRQRLHRTIDVTLIGFSTLSILAFLLALAILHHVQPWQHWALAHLEFRQLQMVVTLQAVALLGLFLSLIAWLLVAVATPAPVYLTGMALSHARLLQSRATTELHATHRTRNI